MKNIIIQTDKEQVIKICQSKTHFQKELYIYNKEFPFTPKLLDDDNENTLILEYIDGIQIGKLIEPNFSQLATIIADLHNCENKNGKTICHFDNNPKNYLFKKKKYYMIDFSNWCYDFPETDLIHFLLFWASITKYKKFKRISKKFINKYSQIRSINTLEWSLLFPEVTKRFDYRRKKHKKIETNDDLIRNRNFLNELC